jgi:hypothetical protein
MRISLEAANSRLSRPACTPPLWLPYDGDTELVAWAEEHQGEFDLTG